MLKNETNCCRIVAREGSRELVSRVDIGERGVWSSVDSVGDIEIAKLWTESIASVNKNLLNRANVVGVGVLEGEPVSAIGVF